MPGVGQLPIGDVMKFVDGHLKGFAGGRDAEPIAEMRTRNRSTQSDVAAFADALEQADGPVLGFCRTGTRSTTLWALGPAGKQPTQAILKQACGACYATADLPPRRDAASHARAAAL